MRRAQSPSQLAAMFNHHLDRFTVRHARSAISSLFARCSRRLPDLASAPFLALQLESTASSIFLTTSKPACKRTESPKEPSQRKTREAEPRSPPAPRRRPRACRPGVACPGCLPPDAPGAHAPAFTVMKNWLPLVPGPASVL